MCLSIRILYPAQRNWYCHGHNAPIILPLMKFLDNKMRAMWSRTWCRGLLSTLPLACSIDSKVVALSSPNLSSVNTAKIIDDGLLTEIHPADYSDRLPSTFVCFHCCETHPVAKVGSWSIKARIQNLPVTENNVSGDELKGTFVKMCVVLVVTTSEVELGHCKG